MSDRGALGITQMDTELLACGSLGGGVRASAHYRIAW